MVMVYHGVKGVPAKENPAMGMYEQGLTALWCPFRNTRQGVCLCGEVNLREPQRKRQARRQQGASYESASSHRDKTRNRLIYTWAGRSEGKLSWRSASETSSTCSRDLGIGVKSQSKAVIAGSSRNVTNAASLEVSCGVKH